MRIKKVIKDIEEKKIEVPEDLNINNDIESGAVEVPRDLNINNEVESQSVEDLLLLFINQLDYILGVKNDENLNKQLAKELLKNDKIERATAKTGIIAILTVKYGKVLFKLISKRFKKGSNKESIHYKDIEEHKKQVKDNDILDIYQID